MSLGVKLQEKCYILLFEYRYLVQIFLLLYILGAIKLVMKG